MWGYLLKIITGGEFWKLSWIMRRMTIQILRYQKCKGLHAWLLEFLSSANHEHARKVRDRATVSQKIR